MSITKINPRTIHLAGPCTKVDDIAAGGAVTPGMLVEVYDDSGTNKWRANASATEIAALAVALDRPELNDGIDDAYAADDLCKVGFLAPGSVFYGLIPSGQDISNGALLQSNGDGKLKAATATTQSAGLGRFQSLDNVGAVVVDTRLRIQVIQ
jgi:hypothetical protein